MDDSSGKGNNGTVNGGATLAADRFGNANKAYSFDGGDDYISVDDDDTLDFGTGDFTVSIWAKYPSTCVQYAAFFAKQDTSSGWCGIWGMANNPAHMVSMELVQTPHFYLESVATGLDDDLWHHFIYIREGTELMLYVDGVLDNTSTDGGPTNITNASSLWFGRHMNGVYYFTGSLDEALMYSRALTAGEISILYHRNGWDE